MTYHVTLLGRHIKQPQLTFGMPIHVHRSCRWAQRIVYDLAQGAILLAQLVQAGAGKVHNSRACTLSDKTLEWYTFLSCFAMDLSEVSTADAYFV